MKIISPAVVLVVLAVAPGAQAPPPAPDRLLPARLEPVYRALDAAFEPQVAMDTVRYMDQFWRVAGNPGFNRSQEFILASLTEAGIAARLVEFPNEGHGWELLEGRERGQARDPRNAADLERQGKADPGRNAPSSRPERPGMRRRRASTR